MSDPAPTVGLALIAKNEAKHLPTLLGSIEGAFDQVVLVDTGCTDRTVQIFWDWVNAQVEQHGPFKHACRVESFEWSDDFAAARTYADSLLATDFYAWADCDDVLVGAQNLRGLAAQAPGELAAFVADYRYAHDQHGNCVCTLRRERLVRAGRGQWTGRVHEAQLLDGPSMMVDRRVCEWVHRKDFQSGPPSSKRNLRILRKWVRDEPDNPRVLGYLGTEEAAQGRDQRALTYFRAYLKLKTGWDEERAQIHRKYARSLMNLHRHQDAHETALAALSVMPDWPDTYLTLAESSYHLGAYDKAIKWARRVLELGMPDSLLILNPLDYTVQPRIVLAGALAAQGQVAEANATAEEALAVLPDHPELLRHNAGWKSHMKREHVADSWAGAAELLIAQDEQLKALTLLQDTVPYFATDHPRIVALRSMLRERLLWVNDPALFAAHYETGGSKPEDCHTDEQALAVGDVLPRCAFLRDGLREQLQEAA